MPERARIVVRGAVQGVGFRPFVYRLATELQLNGWVSNTGQGVFIEVEGEPSRVRQFLFRLEKEKPPRASIQSLESSFLDPAGYADFEISESQETAGKTAVILPDIATCEDCVREIFDPPNRRFGYPFTNCTNCGPRFTIIESLPYDRANTSMKRFTMCAECDREYHDPRDRRFHAQPNACARCGPQLELWDGSGGVIAQAPEALLEAAEIIRDGKILALKGIGGFHLLADARNNAAVTSLRERKHREEKPFAVMSPTIESVREHCDVSELEDRLLRSAESPIVLLQKKSAFCNLQSAISTSVAPGNPNLGVMLPNTPLHHLLMRELGFPVVATSGNLSDEPICIDEDEAVVTLGGVADFFLTHNRPIVRHMDDSIVRTMAGREMVLRRARGYAPLPITRKSEIGSQRSEVILAVGAHLKNTVALQVGPNVFISQHIGDLETQQAYSAFRAVAEDLPRLYEAKPDLIMCDMHPDYLSTKYAAHLPAPSSPVQHHWAHIASCMAENDLEPPALGVAWDGTGYGADGTIWGGEFLLANGTSFTRVAYLRQFPLPGGEAAIKEPRRSRLGLLHEIFRDELWEREELIADFSKHELSLLRQMLEKKVNAPITSSAGRLFDAVGSLIGLRQQSDFEGQAAMEMEFAVQAGIDEAYPFSLTEGSPSVVDWQPCILGILEDKRRGKSVNLISAKFHNMLAEVIVAIAQRIGEPKVVLSGGCFQNRYLTERTIDRLRQENFRPYWHQRVPPNDGGIALGQVAAVIWSRERETSTA
ncbi:MAG: carbamoyltransferase HypF [Verrucomicrobiota bacterium]|nr:carbamoyltransferase HypF [Verrucomicrobiota bacterium]